MLLSVCRLYILAANGSGTNAFTLRGCGIRDTYIDYVNFSANLFVLCGNFRCHIGLELREVLCQRVI